MKIVTVIGARPQFVKAATVSRSIQRHNLSKPAAWVEEIILHTGQHYDENMSRVFFDELHIPHPRYNLGVGSELHGSQTGKMLAGIEDVLLNEKPDLVLTHGDTNSTLAGALAAVKLHIPSAHVESGLRSFNRRMPEEINRIVADQISNILFCPTDTALRNIHREGLCTTGSHLPEDFDFNKQIALNVGDVMFDSVIFNQQLSETGSNILKRLQLAEGSSFDGNRAIRKYCLATIHRPENTDEPEKLSGIFQALTRVSRECRVVVPIHPRTRKYLARLSGFSKCAGNENRLDYKLSPDDEGLTIISPVGYLDMLQLEKYAGALLTDSGGVQKEAFMLKVPCITLRNETEWVETVDAGWNILTGTDADRIADAFAALSKWKQDGPPFANESSNRFDQAGDPAPYGDGRAAEKIVGTLASLFRKQ
jgi:UDP-N-acetylglucosamine 2-epimerase